LAYFTLTSEHIAGARGLLHWTRRELSKQSGVALTTIVRLEKKPGILTAHYRTIEALRDALESAGVEFMPGPGVRLNGKAEL
jgi:DNA-binding XRE family transcriptional regulator